MILPSIGRWGHDLAKTFALRPWAIGRAKIALAYGGTIDKFVGDAMLIFFGDPETKGDAGSVFGTYRTEQIGRLGALIVSGWGTRAPAGPAIGEFVLLADPHLVLEPDLYRCARRELGTDFRHAYSKVFLNAAMASGSCL